MEISITSGTVVNISLGTAVAYAPAAGTATYAVNAGTAVNISGTIAATQITNTAATLGAANAFTVGGHTIVNSVATAIPLQIKGASAQTADFIQFRDSNNALQASVDAYGHLYSNAGIVAQNANTTGTSTVVTIQATTNQTGDLQQWLNDRATSIVRIVPDYSVSASSRDYGAWLFLGNATAPTSNPVLGGYIYVESGDLKYRSPSGVVTNLVSGTATYATTAGTAAALNFGTALTATTATAGSNGAVPAQVAGYIKIKINNVDYKLPYFNV